MVEKVRPDAKIETITSSDGWDSGEVIRYSCPNCSRRIKERQQACEHCALFFDWSKRAYIRTITTVEWR